MPTAFPALPPATDIAGVVRNIDAVIAWSIANQSRLGYFAALYKRITRAIGAAVASGAFQDGPRMERFDAAFANRYFAALSGYFDPAHFPAPSVCWRIAFDAVTQAKPVIVLHMLAGVNAHIDLDLGIAAHAAVAPGPIEAIHADFDTVNTVLTAQVKTVLAEIDAISPVLGALYDVAQEYEIATIDDALIGFRNSAWEFATMLAMEPGLFNGPTIAVRDMAIAAIATMMLNPPGSLASIVNAIARKESTDIVRNIHVLDGIASEAITLPATSPSTTPNARPSTTP